jgi:hypothetical protein
VSNDSAIFSLTIIALEQSRIVLVMVMLLGGAWQEEVWYFRTSFSGSVLLRKAKSAALHHHNRHQLTSPLLSASVQDLRGGKHITPESMSFFTLAMGETVLGHPRRHHADVSSIGR